MVLELGGYGRLSGWLEWPEQRHRMGKQCVSCGVQYTHRAGVGDEVDASDWHPSWDGPEQKIREFG